MTDLTHCAQFDMSGYKYMVHVDMKFGPFLLKFSSSGCLYWDEVMMFDAFLHCLKDEAGLLCDEGLVAGVADAGDVAHAARVLALPRDCQVGATLRFRAVFGSRSYSVR